jgi:hypothetical protein
VRTSRIVFAVAALLCASAVSATDVLVAGRTNVVKAGKLALFVLKSSQQPGGAPFLLPVPGSGQDPTVAGATVALFDTALAGAGSVSFNLDASGWVGLGNPAGSRGYRYKGRDDLIDVDPQGTCTTVLMTEKVIRATCKGSAVTLSPPFSGDGGIVLGLPGGVASLRYCARFGGQSKRNDTKTFKRKDAPVPGECPFVEPTPTPTPTATVTPTATPTVTPSCAAGLSFGGACWFPGGLSESCDQVCSGEGLVYDDATRTVAGSDGSDANCLAILNLFSFPSPFVGGVACDPGFGVGCSSMPIEFVSARCTSPPTTADASVANLVRICACQVASP